MDLVPSERRRLITQRVREVPRQRDAPGRSGLGGARGCGGVPPTTLSLGGSHGWGCGGGWREGVGWHGAAACPILIRGVLDMADPSGVIAVSGCKLP